MSGYRVSGDVKKDGGACSLHMLNGGSLALRNDLNANRFASTTESLGMLRMSAFEFYVSKHLLSHNQNLGR